MKIFKIVLSVIFGIICVALALISLATIIPSILFLGSFANIISISFAHIVLPVVGAFWVLSIILLRFNKPIFIFALVCLSFYVVISGVTLNDSIKAFKKEGVNVSFFKSYVRENVKDVKVDSYVYDSVYPNSTLDVYGKENTSKPVIMYVHGGGWISGAKTDHAYRSKLLAKNGYLVISVDYELSNKEKHLCQTTETQILKAISWVQDNASELNADVDRFYMIGDSAGGNLILDVSYKINSGVYFEVDGKTLPKIKKVCALYPVVDPVDFWGYNDRITGKAVKNMCEYYFGGTPLEVPELYSNATPLNYISATCPNTLIIVGENDSTVPSRQSLSLAEKLSEKSVENKLIIVPYANHAFDFDGTFGDQGVNDSVKKWFSESN